MLECLFWPPLPAVSLSPMAFSVSVGLFALLWHPKSCFQIMPYQIQKRRLVSGSLSRRGTGRKEMRQLFPITHQGGKFLSTRNWQCCVDAPRRPCSEPIICPCGVSSPPISRFLGYWIGPDVDDGWGFIEADVYRID